ncbi:nodulation S family protein [Pseudosulfitobacter koreensis]|uniref:Nodulation S family protein n=1 Tax=Pseudosulfitobacter koreensis TaxID=2968472 RepID=A0ABT1Z0Q2_9RHOB|nr:nodulation S family protein [Pseudosulfitobacter koreense]MCR8826687.1 nodulation S family protein [Pseudosulfitobacter koreense]
MTVEPSHLDQLYADTDDPWNFRTSRYEQDKFAATREALGRADYAHALELGCGNGALARHLAPLCAAYTGVDAVARAVRAAQEAVPAARFVQGWVPDDLPGEVTGETFDLIVLSEILYFLDRSALARLAGQIDARWPRAEVLCVTWLGDTGHSLTGAQALEAFNAAFDVPLSPVMRTADYRIDRRLGRGDA